MVWRSHADCSQELWGHARGPPPTHSVCEQWASPQRPAGGCPGPHQKGTPEGVPAAIYLSLTEPPVRKLTHVAQVMPDSGSPPGVPVSHHPQHRPAPERAHPLLHPPPERTEPPPPRANRETGPGRTHSAPPTRPHARPLPRPASLPAPTPSYPVIRGGRPHGLVPQCRTNLVCPPGSRPIPQLILNLPWNPYEDRPQDAPKQMGIARLCEASDPTRPAVLETSGT